MTSPSQPVRRAACEECRAQKLKCSGEHPSCSRCTRRNIECIYMKRRPMGRPKKRRETTTPPRSQESRSRQTTPAMSIRSLLNSLEDSDASMEDSRTVLPLSLPNSEIDGVSVGSPPLGLSVSIQSCQLDESMYAPPITTGNGTDPLTPPPRVPILPAPRRVSDTSSIEGCQRDNPACVCISRLYLALENLRCKEKLEFHSNLCLLRRCMTVAREVLGCAICPLRYISAIENAQVLATLMVAVAERFKRIVGHVEDEAKRAVAANERKTVQLSLCGSGSDDSDMEDGVSFEVDPREWKCLLKKAARAEIFGLKDGSHPCYSTLLTALETRQREWYRSPPSSDWPMMTHGDGEHGDPPCLRLLESSRGLIEPLQFDCFDLPYRLMAQA